MSDDAKHEILIIHRGGHGDHDDHHGGAWKIAFADFMCAMMAFFLVMWLVSANDKTKASVAHYFNPVRLVDATAQPRGLSDSKKDDSGAPTSPKNEGIAAAVEPDKKGTGQGAPSTADTKPETPTAKEKRLDAALRENPYAALAEIVAAKGPGDAPKSEASHTAAPVIGRRGGDGFRDPFAPQPTPPSAEDDTPDTVADAAPKPEAASPAADKDAPPAPKAAPAQPKQTAADAEKAQLVASLKDVTKDKTGPGVDVKRTDEGVLVSLTDTADFSMFSSGSAVPARRVVMLMEKIAKMLKDKPGTIVLRGYTDNKPFKKGRYDNWHLSLDRAQTTHYMLVRGGLDESRIGHIEGFADHGTRAGTDPASPLNRRIEILLKDKA